MSYNPETMDQLDAIGEWAALRSHLTAARELASGLEENDLEAMIYEVEKVALGGFNAARRPLRNATLEAALNDGSRCPHDPSCDHREGCNFEGPGALWCPRHKTRHDARIDGCQSQENG